MYNFWSTPDFLIVNSINIPTIQSEVQYVLQSMLKYIGSEPFMLHKAQASSGIPQHNMYSAFVKDYLEF